MRLKKGLFGFILGLVLSITITPVIAGSFLGEWAGEIKIPGSPLSIVVHLAEVDGKLQGSIDIPLQGVSRLPLEKITMDIKKEKSSVLYVEKFY